MKTKSNDNFFAEFFAGVGLMRMAAEHAGWQCNFANDIDKKKFETYKLNFDATDYKLGDIWDVNPLEVPDSAALYTASFPCVDLSAAGRREGIRAERSGTFWALISLLKQKHEANTKPKFVLIENVYGYLTTNGGKDLKQSLVALNELGYLVDVLVVNAAHFTAQSRVRIFIIALDETCSNANIIKRKRNETFCKWSNEIELSDSSLRPQRLIDFMKSDEECNWFTVALPALPRRNSSLEAYIEDFETDDPIWWKSERHEKIKSQISDKHFNTLRQLQKKPTYSYGTIYRRMRKGKSVAEVRMDGVAGCLRTPRGGSSKQIIARTGKGELQFRLMTPREYARLQGVEDSFSFSGSVNDRYFAMGDAVCVPAVSWLINNHINKVSSEKRNETFMTE